VVVAAVVAEDSFMAIRPFKLVNRTERSILASRLSEGVRLWADELFVTDKRPECTLVSPEQTIGEVETEREWFGAKRSSEAAVAVGLPRDWPADLARLVFSGRPNRSLDAAGVRLMREVGAALVEELARHVLAALQLKGGGQVTCGRVEKPLDVEAPGRGFVLASCQIGAPKSWLIVIWPSVVLESVGQLVHSHAPGPVLATLSKALQSETVRVEAVVGEAELTLQELATLAVGDVLKLDRKITQSVQLQVRGGGGVCAGRLGASKGRAVLQLTQSFDGARDRAT
jgi:hypothetical protein